MFFPAGCAVGYKNPVFGGKAERLSDSSNAVFFAWTDFFGQPRQKTTWQADAVGGFAAAGAGKCRVL